MNIARKRKQNQKLFESVVDISPTQMAQVNSSSEDTISDINTIKKTFENESNMFKFDNGSTMGKINSGISIRFGLLFHAQNTSNFEEFCDSVKTFVGELSENDIKKLSLEYKHYKS